MGRIILLGKRYFPSQKKLDELERIQAEFNMMRASIMLECKYDKWAYQLRLDMLHNLLRDKLEIIDGGLKDEPTTVIKGVSTL